MPARLQGRHNWVIPPGGSSLIDVPVTERYTYGGVGGRISAVETEIRTGDPADNDRPLFTYQLDYDPLGRVSGRSRTGPTNAAATSP